MRAGNKCGNSFKSVFDKYVAKIQRSKNTSKFD